MEENFTICNMDDIDVVLGLTFLEPYNGIFNCKKRELIVQSDDQEFVLPPKAATSRYCANSGFKLSHTCFIAFN